MKRTSFRSENVESRPERNSLRIAITTMARNCRGILHHHYVSA